MSQQANDECVCAETGSRNCLVHQEQANVKRITLYETLEGSFVYEGDEEDGDAKRADYVLYTDYAKLLERCEAAERGCANARADAALAKSARDSAQGEVGGLVKDGLAALRDRDAALERQRVLEGELARMRTAKNSPTDWRDMSRIELQAYMDRLQSDNAALSAKMQALEKAVYLGANYAPHGTYELPDFIRNAMLDAVEAHLDTLPPKEK